MGIALHRLKVFADKLRLVLDRARPHHVRRGDLGHYSSLERKISDTPGSIRSATRKANLSVIPET